ncbi:unnamed protein product [Closterium sp. NIES-54]
MYGSSSRPSTVGELLDGLRRAAGDRCGVVVDQGARQLQVTGLGDGWAVDQEGQFDREVDRAVCRPDKPPAAIVTMVDPVDNAGVADTLEARLANARKRHADGEYGTIPLLIVELGIRPQWATEHPSCPVSPRPVRNEGGVDDKVDGGARVSGNYGTKQIGVIKVNGGVDRSRAQVQQSTAARIPTLMVDVALLYEAVEGPRRRRMESIEPQLEVAGLKGFADGTVPIPPVDDVGLRGEFRAAHLLTFMVISRDDLYIAQLEEKMTHIRMGEQESATDYYNRARRILAEMRMAGAEYSTASYISHIVKGLPRGYNLMKRMMMVPRTRESLDEDSITSYILQDEAMQEAKQPMELLPQAKYAAPTKLNLQPGQRRMHGGGGSGDVDHSSGKSRGDGEASCSMVGLVEPTVSLAPEAGEDFQAVAAAVQANPMVVPLDTGCSHHLMGTKAVFVDMEPSDGVKHIRGFNRALQPVVGRGTVAMQGEAGKRVLTPDVLYVPGSAGQLKESGVQLKGDGDEMLLIAATGGVLGRARYTGRVLCTDLRPCSNQSQSTEVVALRTIVSATMSTPDRLHARLAHVSVDTITSLAKHGVATGLDIIPSTRADPPCVSCVGGKLAQHTFLAKGSDVEEALAVVHIELCGPFRVAAKDGSLYFLLLKDRHTRFVWVMPVAEKSDVLQEFQNWLVLVERQTKKSVLMLRSDRGGEFLEKDFTEFVDGKGIVHDLTCPYTPQQNGMAEREMGTAVESSTTPPRTTPYLLLTGKKPDLTLARVWGCIVQFMVPEQQRGGKLAPKARWGLHLGVSPESKGWEVLDLTDNKVVTSVEVIFYETLSLEVWKAKFGLASGRMQAHPPTNTSTASVPLLAKVDEPADEDVVEVFPPPPVLAPPFPIADWPASTPVSATGDEGSLEASPVAPASGIAGGRQGAKLVDQGGKPSTIGEQQTGEPVEQEAAAEVQSTKELLKSAGGERLVDDLTVDEEGELSAGEESTDSDVVEVPITTPEMRRTAAFIAMYDEVDDDLLYDDAEEDDELPELDPDMHADPEHHRDIATMTVKEVLASWKGEVVKAAMEEEIRSLVGMGT